MSGGDQGTLFRFLTLNKHGLIILVEVVPIPCLQRPGSGLNHVRWFEKGRFMESA